MDRVLFLNRSGAIVTKYPAYRSEEPLPIAPYVETVYIPVVSVDSSALYGDHPENLATLTYSSGAALTFFCDSEAGGTNTSGAGTFDDPWRSMNTASRFLECNACVLAAAAEYIQLKVKGTVDYHTSSRWDPFHTYSRGLSKFIIRGWGERCDLAVESNPPYYSAGYFFGVRVWRGVNAVCSDCAIISAYNKLAVDCDLGTSALVSTAYNCSAPGATSSAGTVVASVCCYGGSFSVPLSARYAYAPTVSVGYFIGSDAGLFISGYPCAAAGANVTVSCARSATAIWAYGQSYLGNCNASAVAVASEHSPGNYQYGAWARVLRGGTVVSGGSWYAAAYAGGSDAPVSNLGGIEAEALAEGFGNGVAASGASVTLNAVASVTLLGGWPSRGWVGELERIRSGGTECFTNRTRYYSGSVVTSTNISSGCS